MSDTEGKYTLHPLFKRAFKEGDLDLRESSFVKEIFQSRLDCYTDCQFATEMPSLSSIATKAGDSLLDILVFLRNSNVQPRLVELIQPHDAIRLLRKVADLNNT
ncbi:MAG TPA: hypothetical protein PL103_06695 [Saccharofermentans sp.]|nr:hypothetical protein [Saccharofermentans sp.]